LANARKRKTTARKRSTTSKRRSKSRRRTSKRASGWLRKLAWFGVTVGFVAGFASSLVVIRLDRIVRERFEGQRFRVPSRVYSTPSIIYPGLEVELADLRGSFVRLGYREAGSDGSVQQGQYSWQKHRVRVHLRAFEHPTRSEPARDVVFRIRDGFIEEILELPSGRTLGAVLIEPEQLGAYYGPDRSQRELVSLEDLPPHLVDAIVSVEDQRFEVHPGIDVRRIGGALLANLRAGGIRQGGSTLTQQLVKNFFLTPERTLKRKANEAVMALLVELRYSKREILEAYLNEIYLGQRGSTEIHGVGEAALRFFGKRVQNLSLAESALLAALISSPNGISPYRNPEGARARRDLVLELMAKQGRIEPAQRDVAIAEPLSLAAITPDPGDARYFLDLLRIQLSEHYDATVLSSQGLRVYSTLESRTQRLAAIALREGIEQLESQHPALVSDDPIRALQGCLIAIRPQTGEIVALVGGRDYRLSQFDRCTQARRPAGSTFKPFVYIAALEPRVGGPAITLASFLDDSPLEISTPSGPWQPRNFDREFHGRVGVREALERSFNVATAMSRTGWGSRASCPSCRVLHSVWPTCLLSKWRAPTRRSRAAVFGHRSTRSKTWWIQRAKHSNAENSGISASSTREPPTWPLRCFKAWRIAELQRVFGRRESRGRLRRRPEPATTSAICGSLATPQSWSLSSGSVSTSRAALVSRVAGEHFRSGGASSAN